jgi:hypothetical protein
MTRQSRPIERVKTNDIEANGMNKKKKRKTKKKEGFFYLTFQKEGKRKKWMWWGGINLKNQSRCRT